jgi:hypothetical protein
MPDYTRLTLGTKTEKGEIKKCPHCGRRGAEGVESGKTFYLHSMHVGKGSRGLLQLGWDMCPKPPGPD